MAAHVMDLPFWALGLRHPTAVEATGPEVHPDGAPAWVLATYDFPGVKFHWSDGGRHHELVKSTRVKSGKDGKLQSLAEWGLGILFVGDKGMLAADYGRRILLPEDQFAGFKAPTPSIPQSIGHWNEWAQACKTGGKTTCNFDYSGALTETILLGIVAYRTGTPLKWDAKSLKVTNSMKAQELVRKEYRKGWGLSGWHDAPLVLAVSRGRREAASTPSYGSRSRLQYIVWNAANPRLEACVPCWTYPTRPACLAARARSAADARPPGATLDRRRSGRIVRADDRLAEEPPRG
jgi:hypothetical protein